MLYFSKLMVFTCLHVGGKTRIQVASFETIKLEIKLSHGPVFRSEIVWNSFLSTLYDLI
jgi:hypothetical protein